jgi:hypothetical protein
LVGKLEGKRPRRRPRCKCEDSIRMDPREIGLKGVNWMHLGQDAGFCEHRNESFGSINEGSFLTSLVISSL